jgi:hypothetical protein
VLVGTHQHLQEPGAHTDSKTYELLCAAYETRQVFIADC